MTLPIYKCVKYGIFLLVIYTILRTLPDASLQNKDLVYIMGILTVGFMSIDYINENFNNVKQIEHMSSENPFDSLDFDFDLSSIKKIVENESANKKQEVIDLTIAELPRVEPPRAEPTRAEPPRAEPTRAEPPRAEPPRAEPPRAEPPRAEPPRAEPPRAEPPRAEPPRAEPVQMEQPRAEPPRAEPPRAEPPRVEPPRVEPPRVEPPRAEPPRAEPPRAEPVQMEPRRAEPVQMEPPRAEPAQMLPAQMLPAQMEPAQMLPAQMEPTQMLPAQMEPTQMLPAQMEPTQMEPAQMEPTQMEPAQMLPAPSKAKQESIYQSEPEPIIRRQMPKRRNVQIVREKPVQNIIAPSCNVQQLKDDMDMRFNKLEKMFTDNQQKVVKTVVNEPVYAEWNDMKYSNDNPETHQALGSFIDNSWDNQYNIINSRFWKVPQNRPPVCAHTGPATTVVPQGTSGYPVSLKEWHDSSKFTKTKINEKWVSDQNQKN